MNNENTWRVSRILGILWICLPFGPALQNLGLLFGLGLSIRRVREIPGQMIACIRSPAALAAHGFLLAFIMLCIGSSLLNPMHSKNDLLAYFLGFSPLLFGPALIARMAVLKTENRDSLHKIFTSVLVFWASVALSQAVIGWRVQGSSIIFNDLAHRAYGFYSHPLTLAYVALLLFPYVLLQLLSCPKNRSHQLAFVSVVVLIVFTQSRMVQILAFALGLWNIVSMLNGRIRIMLLLGTLATGAMVMVTENPISKRFSVLFSENNPDQSSHYPDDRLAFWHAHAEMIKDRPILGHGVHLNQEDRRPYYERIGLSDFPKKYEAHNQFIQAWTEGGILALLSFVGWLIALAIWIKRDIRHQLLKRIGLQTLLVFVLGGMTQNAFFDSEVRFVLMIGALLFLLQARFEHKQATPLEPSC